MKRHLLLAALSGAPALAYEIVWTREVALLVGGQIEAVSAVLVAFFGGLAIGTRWLGPWADRSAVPLRFYAKLEASAGALAIASSLFLRALASGPAAALGSEVTLALACALLLPTTILLGGTLPALVRSTTAESGVVGRVGGWLVGANTTGAVVGVVLSTLCIPRLGLRVTLLGAGVFALAVAALALAWARPRPEATSSGRTPREGGLPLAVLAAAGLVGVATLAYEVLATRAAMLRLGSGLYAWALVLGLFLGGLAAGNWVFAARSTKTENPRSWLGAIELGASLVVALGVIALLPALTTPASGLQPASVLSVVVAVLPAAFLMGGAFPFLVRLGGVSRVGVAAAFARVSAINTAGGILGALAAPFVLLPEWGLANSVLFCAGLNAIVGLGFLARSSPQPQTGLIRAGAALALFAAAAAVQQNARPVVSQGHVLSVETGRQATSVVLHNGSFRTLIVDGDAEAATGGDARKTEELLAVLPLLLHPEPQRLLEVGFGSGISLGTAARFPLTEIHCVEIAPSVLRSAPFFVPDNGAVASGRDPRIRIVREDGRTYLARHLGAYDIVVANTLHPWSVGATGLYSRGYFERVRRALRPDGIAVQWVALEAIGEQTVALILRTMLDVFPEGSIWWGADNVLIVGRNEPAPDEIGTLLTRAREPAVVRALGGLEVADPESLAARRLVSFSAARAVLGPGAVLEDDLPMLEILSSERKVDGAARALSLAARLAEAGAREDASVAPLLLWLQSRVARAAGDIDRADRRERLAEAGGLQLARGSRIERAVASASAHSDAGRLVEAEAAFRFILREEPDEPAALYGLATVAFKARDFERSAIALERLLELDPNLAKAWNLLGAARERLLDSAGARRAFESALRADPFLPRALANAGFAAVALGDRAGADSLLERLREISPLGTSDEERALRRAIRETRTD